VDLKQSKTKVTALSKISPRVRIKGKSPVGTWQVDWAEQNRPNSTLHIQVDPPTYLGQLTAGIAYRRPTSRNYTTTTAHRCHCLGPLLSVAQCLVSSLVPKCP